LPPDVAQELGNSLGGHFSLLAISGGVLLLAAIIGKIFTVFTKKSSRK
jgi:Ni,Fe-hydrogenase I cytochrome b subunit